MKRLIFTMALLAGLSTGTVWAQGPVELAGFGRYTMFTRDRPIDSTLGFGGALSLYLTNRIRLSADASFTSAARSDTASLPKVKYTPLHIRAVYELPIGSSLRLMAGTGYVRNFYKNSRDDDFGISSIAGLKVRASNALSLYAQVNHDWMPPGWNTADPIAYVALPGVFIQMDPYTDINMAVEAGLALRVGGKKAEQVVITEPVRPSEQVKPPVTPPPPPPVQEQPQQPAQPPVQQPTATPTPPKYATLVPVYFDVNKSDIRDDAVAVLNTTANILNANPSAAITIIGNADERGTSTYNKGLGLRRAKAVKQYLTDKGIAADRLTVESAGETQPADPGHNEDAWAKNRRVDFRVKGDTPLLLPR